MHNSPARLRLEIENVDPWGRRHPDYPYAKREVHGCQQHQPGLRAYRLSDEGRDGHGGEDSAEVNPIQLHGRWSQIHCRQRHEHGPKLKGKSRASGNEHDAFAVPFECRDGGNGDPGHARGQRNCEQQEGHAVQ